MASNLSHSCRCMLINIGMTNSDCWLGMTIAHSGPEHQSPVPGQVTMRTLLGMKLSWPASCHAPAYMLSSVSKWLSLVIAPAVCCPTSVTTLPNLRNHFPTFVTTLHSGVCSLPCQDDPQLLHTAWSAMSRSRAITGNQIISDGYLMPAAVFCPDCMAVCIVKWPWS